MSDRSSIEWTDATWSPVTGCDQVSSGCDHCYAMTMAKRLKAMGSEKYQRDGDPRTSGPGFGVSVHEDVLSQPFSWRKPRKVFVNSMSDLFHKDVPEEFIAEVFAVMALSGDHTFQVLTKRHARMRSLLNSVPFWTRVGKRVNQRYDAGEGEHPGWSWTGGESSDNYLGNVWLGVSVEDQQWANIRIPALMSTPAAVRFLSCEPLLGSVDLTEFALPDWVIVGGESGRNARPIDPSWVRDLRDQCTNASDGPPGTTAFFFKQWGGIRPKSNGRELDGRTWDEYPAAAS